MKKLIALLVVAGFMSMGLGCSDTKSSAKTSTPTKTPAKDTAK